jgi:subtilisin family serine protease
MHFSKQCWNFVNDSADVQDDNGHGTMTASEMCAGPGTGFGITGGAYDAELMVLKALDANGQGSSSQVSAAIYFAVDHGASVINLSLGQNNPDSLIHNALSYAQAHDVVVVAAAGNSAGNQPCYPAAYAMVMPHVIAVGSTPTSGAPTTLSSFSNQAGTSQGYNFVTAPGENLTGFGTGEQLWSWSGTSVAAPLVSAQAALLASAQASQHARDIVQSIMESADALEMMFGGPAAAVGSDQSLGSTDAYLYEKSVFVEDSKLKVNASPFDHMY